MKYSLKNFIEKLEILDVKTFENLAVIYFKYPEEKYEYIGVRTALENGTFFIKEDVTPTVRNLIAINDNEIPVLILRGQILKGGAQNRIVNTTVLIRGKSFVKIPVNCVEQGRWNIGGFSSQSYRRSFDDFDISRNNRQNINTDKSKETKKTEFHLNGMACYNISLDFEKDKFVSYKRTGRSTTDQGKIWEKVSHFLKVTNTQSSTHDYISGHEKARLSIKDYISNLKNNTNANGAAFLTYDRLLGIEVISNKNVFDEYYDYFIESYAIALIHNKVRGEHDEAKYKYLFQQQLDELENVSVETERSVDMGENIIYSNGNSTISGLKLENDLIQFSLLKG